MAWFHHHLSDLISKLAFACNGQSSLFDYYLSEENCSSGPISREQILCFIGRRRNSLFYPNFNSNIYEDSYAHLNLSNQARPVIHRFCKSGVFGVGGRTWSSPKSRCPSLVYSDPSLSGVFPQCLNGRSRSSSLV